MTVTEQLDVARSVAEQALEAGMRPTISVDRPRADASPEETEFSVALHGQSDYGLLHEEIKAALHIAERHGARVWLGKPEHDLSIVWPLSKADALPGPIGSDTPAKRVKREARGVAA